MLRADVPGVVALAAGEPTAPHWPVAEYHRMLKVIAESPGRRGAWVLLLDCASSVPPGKRKPRVAGFAMASHVAGVCDLEAVVVAAVCRGRRYGAILIEAAAAWGEALPASRLELEVRASNMAALRLYRRMGFTVDGTRPGYYRNPDEEAVLMSLRLQAPEIA
jgi:ribosomal-protein-alanine N-acetyltransferase